MKKIAIGITGSSGVRLGIKFTLVLSSILPHTEVFVTFSQNALVSLSKEENIHLSSKHDMSEILEKYFDHAKTQCVFLADTDISAPISSGSFLCEAMAIIPCSANTLAKIANGICDTLITRCASVMLKENRRLLLAPREMPFSSIMLENMLKLSRLSVGIAPPILGYYAKMGSLEEMENFLIGKWLDYFNIPHNLFQRWGE